MVESGRQDWCELDNNSLPPSLSPFLTAGLMQASESDSELDLPTGNAETGEDDFDFYS